MKMQSAEHFHEGPLVAFTSAAIMGAGTAAGRLALSLAGLMPESPSRWSAALVAGFIGAGLVISLLHLGRKSRMFHVLRRAGRSALSSEVLLAGIAAAGAAAVFSLPLPPSAASLLWNLVSFSSVGLLVLIGLVYRLPGRPSWGGAAILSPVLLGTGFGILVQALVEHPQSAFTPIAAALIAVETTLYVWRLAAVGAGKSGGSAEYPELFAASQVIVPVRVGLMLMSQIFALLLVESGVAAMTLLVGIVVDRFAFYALALRRTTESEVARIEAIIQRG